MLYVRRQPKPHAILTLKHALKQAYLSTERSQEVVDALDDERDARDATLGDKGFTPGRGEEHRYALAHEDESGLVDEEALEHRPSPREQVAL